MSAPLALFWFCSALSIDDLVPHEIGELIAALGSDRIEERDRASDALKGNGLRALNPIERARKHADAEIAARASEIYKVLWKRLSPEERSRLPWEKLCVTDVDLMTLTIAVQRVVPIKIVWTNDLDLGNLTGRLVTDTPLGKEDPDRIMKSYRSLLEANQFRLLPVKDAGCRQLYKIIPCPGSMRELNLKGFRVLSWQPGDPRR